MSKASAIFRTATSELAVGPVPRVVGTLSTLSPKCALIADIVEVRLDRIARQTNWLKRCVALQSKGTPVLLTVRLKAEGGFWENDDDQRFKIYKEALGELAAVDVELSSAIAKEVAHEAKRLKKASVISFHDFQKTPPLNDLCAAINKAHKIGSIAKVSTMVQQAGDVDVLRSLLRRKWAKPICVIGMGQAWSKTRIEFATLGSCFTYGYLDKPTAPGQMSAAELMRRVRKSLRLAA
jgi:3-dehydroquinate dehydratase I